MHSVSSSSRQTKPNAHLGYFPPVKTIKEVVGSPLVGVGLQCGLHARRPRDPNPLLLVVPPVPVKAGKQKDERGKESRERN